MHQLGNVMRKINYLFVFVISGLLVGCASSIVDSEGIRTANTVLSPKLKDANMEIYFSGKPPERQYSEIGRVSSRAWVLEKGINALKDEARKLGADAVTDIKYERRLSADYFQDLYFVDGYAVTWE